MAVQHIDFGDDSVQLTSIAEATNGLTLSWSDGHSSFFHYVWLRDCCHCDLCGDCYSSKRFFVPCDIALDVRPARARIDEDGDLRIVWQPDDHVSHYRADWLRAHCYDDAARTARRHTPTCWDAAFTNHFPELRFADIDGDDARRLELFRHLRDYGVAIVRQGPTEAGSVERVANFIGDLGQSAYSRIFDLSPSSKVRTMGNTTRPVPPHTDEPFRYAPPGMMVLGCVRKADDGGDTVLVDGFHLAEVIRNENPDAFALLAGPSQNFIRIHPGSLDQRARVSTFSLDDLGNVVGVRIHTRSTGPLDLPSDQVEAYYAAFHRLTELMMDPANQLHVTLEAGDFALFDNHRVLHARTEFTDPNRHLQICSVRREQFHERYRLLATELGHTDEAQLILASGAAC